MAFSFDEKIVMHTHVEKTAGSSLVRGLIRALGKEHVYDTRPPDRPKPDSLDTETKRQIYVLTGHFHFGTQDRHFDRKKVYIACVRPPLDRFRSYYNFVRVRPNHPGYSIVAGKTFGQVVEDVIGGKNARINLMARTLTGTPRPDRQHVLANVEKNYALVSPHDRVNETLRALVPLFGAQIRRRDFHMNKTEVDLAEDIGELADQFNAVNAIDDELYRFVSDRYETWLANLPERLNSTATVAA